MRFDTPFWISMIFIVVATLIGWTIGTVCQTPAMGIVIVCAANVVLMLAVAVGTGTVILNSLKTIQLHSMEEDNLWRITLNFGPLKWSRVMEMFVGTKCASGEEDKTASTTNDGENEHDRDE